MDPKTTHVRRSYRGQEGSQMSIDDLHLRLVNLETEVKAIRAAMRWIMWGIASVLGIQLPGIV